MRKLTLFFLLYLSYTFSSAQSKLELYIPYNQLIRLHNQLTPNSGNSIAIYAIKEGTKTKLHYTVYKLSTNEILSYDGKPISNEKYAKIYSKINNNIIFKKGYKGAVGIANDSNFLINEAYNDLELLKSMAKPYKRTTKLYARPKGNIYEIGFIFTYWDKAKNKYIEIPGGGGPGGASVVPPPAPPSN